MQYNLFVRAEFIKKTLEMSDEQFKEKCYVLFCREYGRDADNKNNNLFEYQRLCKNYPYLDYIIDIKWLSLNLNHKMGLYMFLNKDGKVMYVGKTTNLFQGIPHSYYDKRRIFDKKFGYISQIKYLIVDNEIDLDILKSLYVAKYKPTFNKDYKARTRSIIIKNINISINKKYFLPVPVKEGNGFLK